MQITIEAKDAQELRSKILDLYGVFHGPVNKAPTHAEVKAELRALAPDSSDLPSPGPDAEEHTDIAQTLMPLVKKIVSSKSVKPKKVAAPPPVEEEDDEPAFDAEEEEAPAAPAAEIKAFTADDAVKALQEVNSKKGLPAARKILAEFNCTRISEVPQKKFGLFITACKTAIQANA